MFRQVITLFRGAAFTATQEFTDRNALLLLQQQLRDGAQAVSAARKAVALASAQNKQEAIQHEVVLKRISDLEERTISAMEQGRDDLARDAAETIALLEAERDATHAAQQQFAHDIALLKSNVRTAEMKLRELQRGQRLATATDRTQRLREQVPDSGLSSLAEAEDTLKRLQERQQRIDLTAEAMDELDPVRMTERLAEAGCGKPLKTSANDVLERLAKRTEGPTSNPDD